MELLIKRHTFTEDTTIGDLFIDGTYFCKVLEDKDRGLDARMSLEEIRSIKVHGKTCIPKGSYEVALSFSQKFQKLLPLLIGVPGYTGIRIHVGNYAKDTEGCILPGSDQLKDMVTNSRTTFTKLFTEIKKAMNKEKVFVTIT